jgi:hypothetical protein
MARDIKKTLRLLLMVFRLTMKRDNNETVLRSHKKIEKIKITNAFDSPTRFSLSITNIAKNNKNRDRNNKIHLLIFNFDAFIFTEDFFI